ncbi:MAG: MmcQ/YjbR family DNA-binding protein [Muribaculaceae bacterium]|nr:MmcQ/YjbR family DNA-binding protein [Muribaculaceae bacterium]
MDIERLREYCLGLGDVEEKTPFGKFAAKFDSVLVFYVRGHMFCMTDMEDFSYVVVKNRPEVIAELLETRNSCRSQRNMSPKYWIELDFGGDIAESQILRLINESFEIVNKKYSPKK